jgi:hypothetical protein
MVMAGLILDGECVKLTRSRRQWGRPVGVMFLRYNKRVRFVFRGAFIATRIYGDVSRSLLPVVLIVFHVEQCRCRFWTFVSRETTGQTGFCFVPRGTSLLLHR